MQYSGQQNRFRKRGQDRPFFKRGAKTNGSRPNNGFRKQFGGKNRFRSKGSFDPSRLIKQAEPVVEEVYKPHNKFADFKIAPALKANIAKKGYLDPTPIQDKAIPVLLDGQDVVGMANTGTGKTAAFLIPLIQKVFEKREEKVLIVAPTRELAVQTRQELFSLTEGLRIYSTLCIGGVSIKGQINELRRNPQFVIGTPGRLKDLDQQRKIRFDAYHTIVLDEVDRMLDMGFIHDIKYITSRLPQNRHSLFFSATMPSTVQGVMEGFLKEPVVISVKTRETAANVDQNVVRMKGKPKADVLQEILLTEGFDKVLVFVRTKRGVDKLSRYLRDQGIATASIHGNKTQNQRQHSLDQFKKNKIRVLLATDVASRGLDIDNVTHVINYDLPDSYEDYIHRIGRTGRANKKGVALSIVE